MSASSDAAFPSVNLIDIPSELLVSIFLYVRALDLVSLCKSCVRFRSVIMDHDHIWNSLCYRDYGEYNTTLQGWNLSTYRDLYTLVLHQYGSILGLWKLAIQHYGGLAHIYVNNGRIIAEQCCAPIRDQHSKPLRMKPMFEITCDENGHLVTCCLNKSHQKHGEPTVKILEDCSQEVKQFSFACHQNKDSDEDTNDIEDEELDARLLRDDFQQWIKEEYINELYLSSNPHLVYGALEKYKFLKEAYQNPLNFTRITVSRYNTSDGCVICPGIYKGTYSSHGIELILVADCKEHVLGTKITGDPNIPAGQWTFQVDLADKMQEEENAACHRLEVPDDHEVSFRNVANHATHYKARYKGFGQIAGRYFHSPEKSPVVMYVINDDEMGLLWVELRCFSWFSRAKEAFLQ